MRTLGLFAGLLFCATTAVPQSVPPPFSCAGAPAPDPQSAAKILAGRPEPLAAHRPVHALVVFAQFKGEEAGPVPEWTDGLLDPDRPGSLAHYYRTMSLGQLSLTGTVLPDRYTARHADHLYQTSFANVLGRYGAFAEEVLKQVDRDIDLSLFDDDGPDGRPNSGDDDGFVDFVFIVTHSAPCSRGLPRPLR